MSKPEHIDIPEWWSDGHMIRRRSALPAEHPENEYNYIVRKYGVDPEDYGVLDPRMISPRSVLIYTMEQLKDDTKYKYLIDKLNKSYLKITEDEDF